MHHRWTGNKFFSHLTSFNLSIYCELCLDLASWASEASHLSSALGFREIKMHRAPKMKRTDFFQLAIPPLFARNKACKSDYMYRKVALEGALRCIPRVSILHEFPLEKLLHSWPFHGKGLRSRVRRLHEPLPLSLIR